MIGAVRVNLLRFLLCLLLCSTVTNRARASEDIGRQWLDLWSRCRVAIESGRTVDTAGLNDLESIKRTQAPLMAGKDLTIRPGYEYAQQSWGRQGNPFVIRETEQPSESGSVTHVCDVQFEATTHVVADDEILAIAKAFTQERKRLIALGGYETRDPDHMWQIAVGVGPIADNRNGCRIISSVMIQFDHENDKAPRYFSSSSGEQTIHPGCHGPALLKPEG